VIQLIQIDTHSRVDQLQTQLGLAGFLSHLKSLNFEL